MVFLNVKRDPFIIHRFCMRICGVWPPDGFKSRSGIIYSVIAFLEIAVILSPLISLFAKCSAHRPLQELRPMAAAIFLSLLRLIVRLYGSRSIPLIESTIDDWSSITDPLEWEIMKRHDKFGTYQFLFRVVWFGIYPCVRDGILVPFPNPPTTSNHQHECAGNETVAKALGWLIVFMRAVDTFSALSHLHLFFYSLAAHLCGQFEILKQQFQEWLMITETKERRREFRRLVMRHSHLLNLGGKLEEAFNVVLAFVIFNSQFMICIHATELGHSIKNADFIEMAVALGLITLYIEMVFQYYYICDYLTTCGLMIGDVFIQCNWYDLPKESVRNFSIVIARSRKPLRFTAINLYKLNLSNFKHVLDTIYSYVSFMMAITER